MEDVTTISASDKASMFIEILEVCINTLLCIRGVYPEGAFVRQRAFGVTIYMSHHQALSEFISGQLMNAKTLFEKQVVERLALCIIAANTIIEQYDFTLQLTPNTIDLNQSIRDTEDQVRDFLIKLTALETQLHPLPIGATFTLLLHTRDNDQVNEFLDNPQCSWGVDSSSRDECTRSFEGVPSIISIKRVSTSLLNFELNLQIRSSSSGTSPAAGLTPLSS
uniref:HORMA domain-containing protein n=1 Tax=Aureoumbra lagunensis TaxID=44058 RepID=A0A7S3K2D2_9STRA|mmetsp:Transcript_17943/g.26972  ORF Transcript_17943/g.26972 Transcript_17943/m.26972 type:complete len:222 (-) Transcript_17943:40-705(-)